MTKREAALILGLRESAVEEKVKDAHKRIMLANHPDAGGSSYVAAKVGRWRVLHDDVLVWGREGRRGGCASASCSFRKSSPSSAPTRPPQGVATTQLPAYLPACWISPYVDGWLDML